MVKVLSKQEVSGDARVVTAVRVVVHSYGPKVGNQSWNHWSIYLILANGSGSVRANMRAEYEGYNNGHLEWSDCPYVQSNSNIRHWDYRCKANTQVREIANDLYLKGRERYDLQGGKGCRFWIYVAGKDLADKGIIASAAPNEIWSSVQYLYHRTNAPEKTAVVQGKFY